MKNCFDDPVNDSLTGSLRVNWALVRKCLRVPFLIQSLGGTGALQGPLREAARIQPVDEQCPAKPPHSPLHC